MKVEINAESMKDLAAKLVRRATAMGVRAGSGKPLEVDQGYELLAALLGFRSQHALRAALAVPVLDARTYATYSAGLEALTADQLHSQCVTSGVGRVSQQGVEELRLMGELLGAYQARARHAADEAFESFDFGDVSVEDVSGWEWATGSTVWSRAVFVRDRSTPDADTKKVTFTVEVVNTRAVSCSVSA